MKHLIKSVTVLENSAGIHYVPLQHFFILSKKTHLLRSPEH